MKKFSPFKFALIFGSILTIISCNFNSSYQNREEDKKDAEHITLQVYALLENRQYIKTHEFFSPKFIAATDTSKLNQIYKVSDKKLGGIKNKEIESWQTNIVKGSNPKSEYLFVYKVERERFNSTETIRLEKENDKIKILAYNVLSEGFDK